MTYSLDRKGLGRLPTASFYVHAENNNQCVDITVAEGTITHLSVVNGSEAFSYGIINPNLTHGLTRVNQAIEVACELLSSIKPEEMDLISHFLNEGVLKDYFQEAFRKASKTTRQE